MPADLGDGPDADLYLVAPWANSVELACCSTPEGRIVATNPAFARKFGLPAAKLRAMAFVSLLHPEDAPEWHRQAAAVLAPPFRVGQEQRWQTAQGWRWIAWEENALLDGAGRVFAVRAIGRDVTKRRLAEEQCYRLARAVEQSPTSVLITNAAGQVQYVNPRFTQVTGYTLEDILDGNLDVLRAGHVSDESYRTFWATLRDGREWRGELHTPCKNGRTIWESVQVSPMRGPSGEIINYLSLREDITERMNLEEQLRQAQKMDSLGTLAGGIAHDFNNMLAIIHGYAEAALLRQPTDERIKIYLREIHSAAQRATGLVRQILTFSRKTELKTAPVDLNALVRDLTGLLSQTFPRTITLHYDLDPKLAHFLGDGNQLQQVVLNLCVNARDAMPDGGHLTVGTQLVARDGVPVEKLPRGTEPAAQWVCLKVTDTGVGMSPEVRARIFEPFFTTRAGHGGNGLGLSVVYGIIQSHHGCLEVTSAPGAGSTFHVYLPLVTSAPAVIQGRQTPGGIERGSESVLIVDDEDSLRSLLTLILQQSGYRVTSVADGQEAIDWLSEPANAVDAVLLDLNMPRRGGLEVFKAMRQLRPEIKFVIVSGNITADVKAELMALGQREFLHKPYRLDEIGTRLRRALTPA
ncbi:MAG: PAS domain S-box protein [Opitutae bacterium]|nr:PAS domain S-box protein [Opitutae bacterium]